MDYILYKTGIYKFKPSAKSPDLKFEVESLVKVGLDEEHHIICKNCSNLVTTIECTIAVNGQHKNTFTNPAGVTYQIGCFSQADGSIVYGVPTVEFTWFGGFSWTYAFYSKCLAHLGWFYQSGSESFFGLILDRLRETIKTH